MLAIVNVADEIAPLTSVAPFIDKMPVKDTRIIELPSEIGVCLPRLGTLVGRAVSGLRTSMAANRLLAQGVQLNQAVSWANGPHASPGCLTLRRHIS
jgi:hypothetical protein